MSDCRAGEQPSRQGTIDEVCYGSSVPCVISLDPKTSESLLKKTKQTKRGISKRGGREIDGFFKLDHFSGLFYCTVL